MKKIILSKKVASILLAASCSFGIFARPSSENSNLFENAKSEIYVRSGSAGIFKHNLTEKDISFGGVYSQFYGSISTNSFEVTAKAKMKLSSAESWDELQTSAEFSKGYAAFALPVFNSLWFYGGKGFVFVNPGAFFSIMEDYTDGSRYAKDGLGAIYKSDFISGGISFYTTTDKYTVKDKLQLGAGISFDFKKFDLPLQAGVNLIYNNGKNYETHTEKKLSSKPVELEDGTKAKIYESTTVYDYGNLFSDIRDYTSSINALYKPNKNITVSAGYAINATPMTTSVSFKRVENYKTPALNHSHILSLVSKWKIKSGDWLNLTIDEEMEGAKAFDEDIYSFYGALRFKQNIHGILNFYPSILYHTIFDRNNASYDRNSLTIYPRFTLEKGKHYFIIGTQFEHREVKENEYNWIWSIPFYYKFTL